MAIEAPISEDDRWFVGEDKILRWTVTTAADPLVPQDVTGWAVELVIRRRRDTTSAPIATLPVPVIDGPSGSVAVPVSADVTAGLEGGVYHYVLRRVDAGANQVLAYGPIVLRRAELA